MKANEDNVLNGRLNMQQHKMINLADPVNSYDAVNLRYVSSRIQALKMKNRRQNELINVNQGMMNVYRGMINMRTARLAPHQDDPEV